jgi:flagellar protein FliS
MRNSYQNYYEDDLREASPLKLVQLLYRGALDSIASARRYLRLGDIRSRSRAISKAMAIVTELALSLNDEQGGELARNLARLYGYVEKLLIQANSEQREQPLEEAERLLSTLADAWATCKTEQPARASEPAVRNPDYEPVGCAY